MKNLLYLLSLTLLVPAGIVRAQSSERKVIVSDEFKLMAVFPEVPRQGNAELKTRLGTGNSHRWFVQNPGVFYEVSVTDLPAQSVSTNARSLDAFYDELCQDLAPRFGKPSCKSDQDDHLKKGGGREMFFLNASDQLTILNAYLVDRRLYLAFITCDRSKCASPNPPPKGSADFFDGFMPLINVDESNQKKPRKLESNPKPSGSKETVSAATASRHFDPSPVEIYLLLVQCVGSY